MRKVFTAISILAAAFSFEILPAEAQTAQFGNQPRSASSFASLDRRNVIAQAGGYATGLLPSSRATSAKAGMRNGLPPTRLDSFVHEAGGKAWHIYGDEGVYSIPPFMEFTKVHRIEAGITGRRRDGLHTGHGSWMPDAWGGDEFVDGQEWSHSGGRGSASQHLGNAQSFALPALPVLRELPPKTPVIPNEDQMTPTSQWRPAEGRTDLGNTGGAAFSWP